MKHFLPLLAVLLSGCVIHSAQPFYTEKSRVIPTDLMGKWQLVKSYSDDITTNSIDPWILESPKSNEVDLVTFDEHNVKATFDVTFFKNGTNLFLDFLPGDPGNDKINEFWVFAVCPVHGICQVRVVGDQLQLIALDYDWVGKQMDQKKLSLPYAGKLGESVLFTATTAQWETFLKKYGNNPEAFPEKHAFILKRIPEKKS